MELGGESARELKEIDEFAEGVFGKLGKLKFGDRASLGVGGKCGELGLFVDVAKVFPLEVGKLVKVIGGGGDGDLWADWRGVGSFSSWRKGKYSFKHIGAAVLDELAERVEVGGIDGAGR